MANGLKPVKSETTQLISLRQDNEAIARIPSPFVIE
jgi:hypothetical protein